MNTVKYGKWEYEMVNSRVKVNHDITEPSSICKYYDVLSCNSIDAITKGYLYCSHPYQLNDTFDSTYNLWDFDNIPLQLKNKIYKENPGYKEIEPKVIIRSYYTEITKHIGIISFANNSGNIGEKNDVMWSLYSENRGVCIVFNRKTLYNNILQNKQICDVTQTPIDYVRGLKKINFFNENSNSFDIPVIRSCSIKHKKWKFEDEWRFIVYATDEFGIPLSYQHDEEKGSVERKAFYKNSDVEKIILDKYFFMNKKISDKKYEVIDSTIEFTINNDKHLKLINFIKDNYNHKLFYSGILFDNNKLSREFEKIEIKQIVGNVVTVVSKANL